jgi:hypothetical protein
MHVEDKTVLFSGRKIQVAYLHERDSYYTDQTQFTAYQQYVQTTYFM